MTAPHHLFNQVDPTSLFWLRGKVAFCINSGRNALIGIQQALMARTRSGHGSAVNVSLFDSAAELMSVPYLRARYGGRAPEQVRLKHPSIAPCGAFTCADGRDIAIAIQNEREWADFWRNVLREPALFEDPRCSNNAARVASRDCVDVKVADVFSQLKSASVSDRLTDAQTAFANLNSVHDLIQHPQLRTRTMPAGGRTVEVPATPWSVKWESNTYVAAPALNEQEHKIRDEFAQ